MIVAGLIAVVGTAAILFMDFGPDSNSQGSGDGVITGSRLSNWLYRKRCPFRSPSHIERDGGRLTLATKRPAHRATQHRRIWIPDPSSV